MAKKKVKSVFSEPIEDKEEPKPIPQISFTEAELSNIVDYMNFISKEATFTVDVNGMSTFAVLTMRMKEHIKKCEDYIFEYKRSFSKKTK